MSILDLELTGGQRLGIAANTVYAILERDANTTTIYTLQWPDGMDVRGAVDEVMGEWWAAIGMWMTELDEEEEGDDSSVVLTEEAEDEC